MGVDPILGPPRRTPTAGSPTWAAGRHGVDRPGTVGITELVGLLQAAAGNGWAEHPDQTGGAAEEFVEGPGTPSAGDGSLQLSVASGTDRALIFTAPNPGTGATPPRDVGPINPVPWADLSGSSYSTYTEATTNVAASLVTMRFVGSQDYNTNNPLLSDGFTTLNFEPIYQPGSRQRAGEPVAAVDDQRQLGGVAVERH